MIALMAIMILCSADTCTISSDDNETFYDGNSDMQLRGTSWKAYSFNDNEDKESIRIEVVRTNNGQMTATIYLNSLNESFRVRMMRQ